MSLTIPALAAEIEALNQSAWSSQYTDPAATLELSARSIALSRQADHTAGLAYGLLNQALYEIRFCSPSQAEATLREAETYFATLGDRRGMLLVRTGVAGILLKLNEFDAAEALLEKVLAAPEQDRQPLDAYFALYRLGYVYFLRGEVQEGLRYYYKALALVQRERSLPLSCLALSDLGSAQMELGNYTEARELLEQAHAICKQTPICFAHMIVANLASVHLEMGNTQAALHIVEHDFPCAGAYFQPGDEAFLWVVAAQAYAGSERWDAAQTLALRALEQAQAVENLEITNQCLWMLGVIACGRKQPEEGIQWLLKAECSFGDLRNAFYVLHVYAALSDAYAAMQQFESAYRYLQRYQQHYETSLGASAKTRYITLQIQHELAQAEFERDYALQQQIKLETLNGELHRKVEEIEYLQVALREQAIRDPLTGLYNRRFLNEQIRPILDQAERTGHPVCMALLDLDFFKRINDTLGHGFGDQVLIDLATLLRTQIRSSDLAIRYGGEEFCLVFPQATVLDALARMEHLLQQFHQATITCCSQSLSGLSFSAGIAQFPLHGTTVAELLHAADTALYCAKNQGRNRVLPAQHPNAQSMRE